MSKPSTTKVVVWLLIAHVLESALFGIGYFFSAETLQIGSLTGIDTHEFRDYLYYSMVTYTSLGLGDVFPIGELRLVSGFEVLTGLLMIGWSGSVLFNETQYEVDLELNEDTGAVRTDLG